MELGEQTPKAGFTNTATVLTLVKQIEPDGGENFGLEIAGPGSADATDTTVLDNESIMVAGAAGTYNLTETDGTGTLTDFMSVLSCDGGTSLVNNGTSGSIDLAAGDNVTCTFTNTANAVLTLVKQIEPDGGENFGLEIAGPGSADATDTTVLDNESIMVAGVAGTYSLIETDGTGTLTDFISVLSCDGGTSLVNNGTSGSIDLAAGDNVTCTFTNTANAVLTLVKQIEPDGGENFGLEIAGPGSADATDTTVLDNESIMVAGAAGTYILTETDGTGTLTDFISVLSCDGGTSLVNNGTSGSIDLAAGDNVTCTFTNTGQPDLTISKTSSGTFIQGQSGGIYNLTVMNDGSAATDATKLVTVTDTLPDGQEAQQVTNDSNPWSCSISGGGQLKDRVVMCTGMAAVAAGASFSPIQIDVSIAQNAQTLQNTATVAGEAGQDSDTGNNTGSVTAQIGGAPDLTITKSHTGDFAQGQTGKTYTLTVSNVSSTATGGSTVTVTDNLPTGLTPTNAGGTNWSCPINNQNVTCTRTTSIQAGNSAPDITITVNVDADATPAP